MSTNRRPSQTPNRSRTREDDSTNSTQPEAQVPAANEPRLPLERLGDMLKRIRTERGDDLQQIADYLCIRRGFLEALEASRYDDLPADAYAIGFLRSYANYLGIEGREAIDRYRNEMSGRRKKPVLLVPVPLTQGRTPSTIILAGAAVAAFLIYIAWYGISSTDRAVITAPTALPSTAETTPLSTPTAALPTTDTTAPAPITTTTETPAAATIPSSALPPPAAIALTPAAAPPSEEETPAAPTPAATAASSDKDSRISIRAEQSSWVLVSDGSGQALYDKVMKPGDSYKVPNTKGLTLTTGNGGGVILTLDGTDLPKLSAGTSHVVRNISLDPTKLKALPARPN